MARFQVPNLAYIRRTDNKLASSLQAGADAINNLSDQANVDPTGAEVAPPSQISGVNVVEKNGIHDVSIIDNSPAYRGIQYSAFYSQSPDMSNAHRIDLGESQNHRANMGSGQYYWGAANKYSASDHSPMVIFGGSNPTAVGSGTTSGPAMQAPQGFTTKYRNSNTPPVRK
jgi:hypothetical protein